jgi:hypothetical protein
MVALHRLLVLVAGAALIAGLMIRLLPVRDFPVAPGTFLQFTIACAVLGIALMLLEIYDKICEQEKPLPEQAAQEDAAA